MKKNRKSKFGILIMVLGFSVLTAFAQNKATDETVNYTEKVSGLKKDVMQVPLEQFDHVDTCDVTRYAIVQKNDRWGIYDLSRHENVTNIDYDYAKFLHRDVVEGESTVAYCFYAEKGIEQGLILVSGDNNQTVEMWHDNPEYVGNLSECTTIDERIEKVL